MCAHGLQPAFEPNPLGGLASQAFEPRLRTSAGASRCPPSSCGRAGAGESCRTACVWHNSNHRDSCRDLLGHCPLCCARCCARAIWLSREGGSPKRSALRTDRVLVSRRADLHRRPSGASRSRWLPFSLLYLSSLEVPSLLFQSFKFSRERSERAMRASDAMWKKKTLAAGMCVHVFF